VLVVDIDQADEASRLIADDERHVHRRLVVLRSREREAAVVRRHLVHVLVDDERLARAHHVRGEALIAERRAVDSNALSALVDVRIMHQVRLGIVDPDAHVAVPEDFPDLVADRVVDPLDVELGRERRLHAVDDRELGVPLLGFLEQALRLVEQASVLERDAHGVGERLQQAHVRIAERVLALHVHQLDESARLVRGNQRHIDRRFFALGAGEDETTVRLDLLRHVFIDHQHLARAQHVRAKALVGKRCRGDGNALPAFVNEREMHQAGLRVVDTDFHVRLVKDLADLVADRVVDALHVQLGGERRLHAVDDRQLRRALLAFLEEALRLVEEAGALQRHAHTRSDRAQQPHLGFAESVLALVVLQHDQTEDAITSEDRHEDSGLAVIGARQCACPEGGRVGAISENDRLPRAQDLRPGSAYEGLPGLHTLPVSMFVLVQVVHETGLSLVPADADVAGVEDFAQLAADQIDDGLEVELLGHPLLDAVDDRELRCALLLGFEQTLRLVEEPCILERHTHACRHGREQPHFGLAEGVFPFVILQRDRAQNPVAPNDRNPDR